MPHGRESPLAMTANKPILVYAAARLWASVVPTPVRGCACLDAVTQTPRIRARFRLETPAIRRRVTDGRLSRRHLILGHR
jgi:hypothetical protein